MLTVVTPLWSTSLPDSGSLHKLYLRSLESEFQCIEICIGDPVFMETIKSWKEAIKGLAPCLSGIYELLSKGDRIQTSGPHGPFCQGGSPTRKAVTYPLNPFHQKRSECNEWVLLLALGFAFQVQIGHQTYGKRNPLKAPQPQSLKSNLPKLLNCHCRGQGSCQVCATLVVHDWDVHGYRVYGSLLALGLGVLQGAAYL